MKPRLEVLPYTKEDADIWVCVGLWPCFVDNDALELVSAIADRTDAALMWSMVGAAAALEASTWERRNLLAFYFGDPFPFCRLLE
jgi:hypothetical protein